LRLHRIKGPFKKYGATGTDTVVAKVKWGIIGNMTYIPSRDPNKLHVSGYI
jgi:hypothetical protein